PHRTDQVRTIVKCPVHEPQREQFTVQHLVPLRCLDRVAACCIEPARHCGTTTGVDGSVPDQPVERDGVATLEGGIPGSCAIRSGLQRVGAEGEQLRDDAVVTCPDRHYQWSLGGTRDAVWRCPCIE